MKPTADRVRELLSYDPETGVFRWRIRPYRSKTKLDDPPGFWRGKYLLIGIDGRQYFAHCLAWNYVTGEWPKTEIDHRDTNPSNNAFSNLREATRSLNNQNRRKAAACNPTGFLGVSRKRSRFTARITINSKKQHLGTFATAEEAYSAYVAAKRESHAGCTL